MKNKLYYQFAGSCFLVVFMFLGFVVRMHASWISGFDQLFTGLIRGNMGPTLTRFFIFITNLGSPLSVGVLTAAIALVLRQRKFYAELLWLVLGVASVGGLLNPLIKLFFGRERPTLPHLVVENSLSFPSGHALGTMLLWGTVIMLLPRLIRTHSWRLTAQILLGIWIMLVGITRIYLGVHFPSDVLGGYCLGLAWLLMTYPIYLERRFVWQFTGKQL